MDVNGRRVAYRSTERINHDVTCCASEMLPASIQISGSALCGAEVQDICDSLREDGVRLLSVRGCQLSDRDFLCVCVSVSRSHFLSQLNLNLGVVSSIERTRQLAGALRENRSLCSLFLHGNPLCDAGLVVLHTALSSHPALVSLDLGDCLLGDQALSIISGLLPPDGAKSGLRELTLSANPGITAKGWARFSIAVSHSSQLRVLNLDYNTLGDRIAGMLAVAVASSRTLEVLDLEGTGLTNQSAEVFLDMVESYPTCLRVLVLAENHISVFLDMVESYPTCLRVLVLAENHISPDLQRQIHDLLSAVEEEEEEEEEEAPPPPHTHTHAHTTGSPAPRNTLQPIREKYQPITWIPHSTSSPQMVMLTSGLGESLLAETEM